MYCHLATTHANPDAGVIRRCSALLAAVCLLLALALPPTAAIYWACAAEASLAARAALLPNLIQGSLHVWQRVAGGLFVELVVALTVLGLWQARQCLGGFARGRIFTTEAVLRLRRFGAWIFASAVADTLTTPVLSVHLTLGNAPGTRQLVVGIGSNQLFALLFAGIVWLMAAVIGQGQALADENAAFL